MKSIVLCERTLVQEREDFQNFKEEKINEGSNGKTEGKKIVNGTSEFKKSEAQVQNSEKDGMTVQNGDKKCLKAALKEDVNENDRSRRLSAAEPVGKGIGNVSTEKADPSTRVENSSCNDKTDLKCSMKNNLSSESENVENSDTKNGSANIEDSNLSSEVDFSVENDENSDDTVQILEEKSESPSQDADDVSLAKTIETDVVDEEKLTHAESKENVQPLDDIVLDLDENKENEKEEKMIILDDFSENDLSEKHSSGCEIQVGKVETISGTEKESMWSENELKKSEKESSEQSEEKLMDECQDISMSAEDSVSVIEGEKEEESHEVGADENLVSEGEENIEEGMHIEVEESDQTEEKGSEPTDLNNYKDTEGKSENLCRKRQMFESSDEDPSSKKKRLSEDFEEPDLVEMEEEHTEDSSRCASLSSLEIKNFSSEATADQISDESRVPLPKSKKRTFSDDKNIKKLKASTTSDAQFEKLGVGETTFSVLEKFRGTLKTLTRSDLEELIIQKLCEVITERSNVGELRQKAQALEQDQERWKAKAQSLGKQMREMEMVMKKYMSEVQKQIKDKDSHVVTPFKVTRSVGLQVSFYSSTHKMSKSNSNQPVPSGVSSNMKNAKGSSKFSSHYCQGNHNNSSLFSRNKTSPSFQKGPPSMHKSPMNHHHRRPIAPKPDYNSSASNKPGVQHSLLGSGRGTHSQASRPGYKSAPGTSPQQSPQQQQQKQQPPLPPPPPYSPQQQQSGSKVIDLTEDDDRQTGNMVKTPGAIRVVNHLTQPAPSQNNRFAYLLPTTSASTGTSAGQNRQVLIATPSVPQPNRQIMCSMPPLLFKGGNVVQGGSQPQMLNHSNKVILPKTLRHPAPLPQRPVNQNTRPSLKLLPPRPALKISKVQAGIVLSWNMSLSPEHAPIASYQLYAYQESDSPPTTSLWKKVGDVKALPLPMACTLTQFMSGHKYHFAVRAVDLHSRIGPFSFPGTIVLV